MSSPVDPKLLLNVLEPILDLYGGVKNAQIANRFVNVMREARKLVHRCVYLNILKATSCQDIRKEILNLGGWNILYDWLKEAEKEKHWDVVKELLELFVELPVTIDLFKLNSTPKLIRQLSKRNNIDTELKHLAADIVLIWKDIIVEASNDSSSNVVVTNHNNNNQNNFSLDKKNSLTKSKNMMRHIDPNIDVEESEDSVSNSGAAVPQSPVHLSPPKPMNNSPGNVFEKLKPTEFRDSFSDAINSADKSLTDMNKRPKTTKSYPSKFRSGFDADPEPPVKKPKPSTPKLNAADIIKATSAKRLSDDGGAKSKGVVGEKKTKPIVTPVIIDALLPPVTTEHSQIPSTSVVGVVSPVSTTPPAIPKAKPAPPKVVQLIESNSFMAALEGNAAQKASLIKKKKIIPKTSAPTNQTTTSTTAATPLSQNKNDLQYSKPMFYKEKEIAKPSTTEESPPVAALNRDGKKRVRWATENELVQIQYFEIDETERINVNRIKMWGDLKHFEMHREREVMEAARKHRHHETNTEENYFPWKLVRFDGLADMAERGGQSQEKVIQAERQKNILAEVYLPGMPLPDTPKEPDLMDRIAQQDPVLIPLDDTGTTNSATQLPPELNKLLEGLKQSGMMPNPNMIGQGNMMNMPNMMRPPLNMPPMMNSGMMPPNTFVPPPMAPANQPPPANMMMFPPNMMPPRNIGPPQSPMYPVNMNMPPRNNWVPPPMNNGPPSRPGGSSMRGKPPYHHRPPFRGGGRPMDTRGSRPPFVKNFRKSCPYFEQGRCTYGDQCRYLHIKRNDGSSQDSNVSSAGSYSQPSYSQSSDDVDSSNTPQSPQEDIDERQNNDFSNTDTSTPASPD